MHLSKLVEVLKKLSFVELKRLSDYVHSPYFKVPLISVTLYDYLLPLYPQFAAQKITPELIGKASKNISTAAKQSTAGSWLLKAIEQFLVLELMQANESSYALHKLNVFKQRDMQPEFEKEYKKTIDELPLRLTDKDIHYFERRHSIIETGYTGFNAKLNRTQKNDLWPALQSLDEYYAAKRLRYMCELVNRQKVLGIPHTSTDATYILNILQLHNNTASPFVYLFTNVYKMWTADRYETARPFYTLIKEYINTHSHTAFTPAIRDAIPYATGICQQWFNSGIEEAIAECQWWTELRIKHDLLLSNNKLLPITFRNIVSIAAQIPGNADFIATFISTYKKHLPEQYADITISFAQGLYHYSLKEYKKAIRTLLQADGRDEPAFSAVIRRWQFICLYEFDSSDFQSLENCLLSFQKYMQRNKSALHNYNQSFKLFIDYSKQLIDTESNVDIALNNLDDSEHFAGKHWIENQFKLKKKKPVRALNGLAK